MADLIPDKTKVTVSTRMTPREREAIAKVARLEDRTISQQVARLLRAGMKSEGVAISGDSAST